MKFVQFVVVKPPIVARLWQLLNAEDKVATFTRLSSGIDVSEKQLLNIPDAADRLEKLKLGQARVQEEAQLPEKIAAFGISGVQKIGLKRLFMTHPPLEERIAALKQAT